MRIFHPLRRKPIALLWSGLVLSAVGDQLYAVALTWIAVGLLGSRAGYLTALQPLVEVLAVLGIGWWADGWDRQRSMIAADLCRALVLLAVVAGWLVLGTPGIAGLVVAIVVLATGEAVFDPALQTMLPGLVEDRHLLPAANGLLDATSRSARLLGPGLVAVLAGIIPVVHFLTLDALSFLGSATALALIARRTKARPLAVHPSRPHGFWRDMQRGARAMRSHPLLGYVQATSGLVSGAWYAVFFLALPLLIARRGVVGFGGSGLGAYGLVIASYGCTNLASTLYFGSRTLPVRPQFQMFAGNLFVGGGMVLMGLAAFLPAPWLLSGLMAAASLGAVGGPMKDIPVAVLRQTRLAHADIAAAMRSYMAVNSAGILVALLAVPSALSLAGIVPVILACGAALIGIGLTGLMRHGMWIETAQAAT